jgi:hypothetical protein
LDEVLVLILQTGLCLVRDTGGLKSGCKKRCFTEGLLIGYTAAVVRRAAFDASGYSGALERQLPIIIVNLTII